METIDSFWMFTFVISMITFHILIHLIKSYTSNQPSGSYSTFVSLAQDICLAVQVSILPNNYCNVQRKRYKCINYVMIQQILNRKSDAQFKLQQFMHHEKISKPICSKPFCSCVILIGEIYPRFTEPLIASSVSCQGLRQSPTSSSPTTPWLTPSASLSSQYYFH